MDCPGEGEHKIVDFIRRQRLDPEFDPNQENVIYGLDADLIMLAMATHEARFRVLREDVFWEEERKRELCRACGQPGHWANECPKEEVAESSPPRKGPGMEQVVAVKPFIFLNVMILREYLEVEMRPTGHVTGGFPFDPDRAIDDWVFLCFFVGNDFLPHLPSLELREGAIDCLIDIYREQAGRLAGHLTRDGTINFARVRLVLERLAAAEPDILRRRQERQDRERERDRGGVKRRRASLDNGQGVDYPGIPPKGPPQRGIADGEGSVNLGKRRRDEQEPEGQEQTDNQQRTQDDLRLHEPGARTRYYLAKFGVDPGDRPDFVRQVCRKYLEGVAWVMAYYYQGCSSWGWFYPFHYAPFAADFVDYLDDQDWHDEIKFDLGKPFRPFDQLMSVFPRASAGHIPEPFRRLMSEELSDYYPDDFVVDLNGKRFEWQGVVLLPFIDEDRLLATLERVYPELPEEKLHLNRRGHDLLFVGERSTLYGFLGSIDADPDGIWPLDVLLSKGLSGSVRLWPDGLNMMDSRDDNAVMAVYFYPPGVAGQESTLRMHFTSRMLPRAQRLPPVLGAEERAAVRSGYSGRGSGYHSMNREWAQRQEQQQQQASSSSSSFFKPATPRSR